MRFVGTRSGLPRLGCPAWHSPPVSGLFSIVLMLIISPHTEARQIAEIRTNGVLRIGTSGDYQPFSLCLKGPESCQGFDIDLAQRMAQDLDVGVQFVRFRWPELLQDLHAGKFDIAMSGITIRPDRALQATFSRPYTSSQSVIVVADPAQLPALRYAWLLMPAAILNRSRGRGFPRLLSLQHQTTSGCHSLSWRTRQTRCSPTPVKHPRS